MKFRNQVFIFKNIFLATLQRGACRTASGTCCCACSWKCNRPRVSTATCRPVKSTPSRWSRPSTGRSTSTTCWFPWPRRGATSRPEWADGRRRRKKTRKETRKFQIRTNKHDSEARISRIWLFLENNSYSKSGWIGSPRSSSLHEAVTAMVDT